MPLSSAIQKRRGGGGGMGTLPMTSADVALGVGGGHSASSSSHMRRRGRRQSRRVLMGQFVAVTVVLLVVFLVNRLRSSPEEGGGRGGGGGRSLEEDSGSRYRIDTSDGGSLPLARFRSLSYALANTDLVGLYFAASWCPMSTPVTEELESVFSQKPGTLLAPGDEGSEGGGDLRRPLAIVYVSSDKTDKDMRKYSRDYWMDVPYDSPDRNGLKRHFRVCAKRELEELGFERKMEIPTLIIIDSVTQGVLTTEGVSNMKEYGEKTLDHWLGLQKLVRALEDKYEDEEKERERERRPEPRIV